MRKLIIFGAGKNGLEIIKKYGKERIDFLCDNASDKWGTNIDGIPIISFNEMVEKYNNRRHIIIVSPDNYIFLTGQLELAGINEFLIYNLSATHNHVKVLKEIEKDSSEHNKVLEYYSEMSRQWDLLEDCFEFRKIVSEVLERSKDGFSLLRSGIGEEGNFYGNLETLLDYANYTDFNRLYAPNVSHNAGVPLKNTETMYNSAVIFSGNYFRNRIHRWRPYIPVFSVGPYIQYAKGIYSDDKVNGIKKIYGKTLTVFLPHSIETVSRKYRKEDFIDDVIEQYGKNFDTILLSVYWADMLEPVVDYAELKGMKIVTSGFRFDSVFNKRLKSLFDITDAVVGGDFGTHYNYAYHFGKNAARIDISDNQTIHDSEYDSDIESKVQFGEIYQIYRQNFFKYYGNELCHSVMQGKWLEPYAGYGITRSPEYIRDIFDISKDILLECDGDLKHYPNAVKSVYRRYQECNDIDKISILVDSTGSYLYF